MSFCEPLLSACVTVDYRGKRVLKGAFLQLRRGEVLGLVGRSGSGKSTLALSILRLLELKGGTATGSAHFRGLDLFRATQSQMRQIRGREIALVLQSPLASLNPALRIGTQLAEAWGAHASGPAQQRRCAIEQAMLSVSLPCDNEFLRRFPSQLSVGQAQRVLIAMAVMHRPALLIADEPTSALDVITQAEILKLFAQLNREMDVAILYISHDLLSVASICQRIAILHEGEIVECGPTAQIFHHPTHAYTQQLIAALPERPAALASYRPPARVKATTVH